MPIAVRHRGSPERTRLVLSPPVVAPGMYEAVHTVPDGNATAARFAATAAAYGFEGLVIRNHGDAIEPFDAAGIRSVYGIDVVDGVELRASDPSRLGGFLGTHRPDRTVVLVHGGTSRVNRFAVGQPRVDVLAHPLRTGRRIDHVVVREAAESDVRLEVSLAPILRETGGRRVRAIARLRELGELIEAFSAPYVVTGDPRDHLQLRAPRDLIAVGSLVGFEPGWIEAGLAEWGRLAARNRDRLAGDHVAPGVRHGPYEEGDRS